MEAKDTVMKQEQLLPLILAKFYGLDPEMDIDWETLEIGCRAQAEVSWKAGEKEMFRRLRQAIRGEPVVFDYALDAIEIEWLYKQTKRQFEWNRGWLK